MATTVMLPEVARMWPEADDDSLEEMVEDVRVDLVLAEQVGADASGRGSIGDLELDFRNDPWHFLRRACQVADYGATPAVPEHAESPRGPG